MLPGAFAKGVAAAATSVTSGGGQAIPYHSVLTFKQGLRVASTARVVLADLLAAEL